MDDQLLHKVSQPGASALMGEKDAFKKFVEMANDIKDVQQKANKVFGVLDIPPVKSALFHAMTKLDEGSMWLHQVYQVLYQIEHASDIAEAKMGEKK